MTKVTVAKQISLCNSAEVETTVSVGIVQEFALQWRSVQVIESDLNSFQWEGLLEI
jgi:hypothetical protein